MRNEGGTGYISRLVRFAAMAGWWMELAAAPGSLAGKYGARVAPGKSSREASWRVNLATASSPAIRNPIPRAVPARSAIIVSARKNRGPKKELKWKRERQIEQMLSGKSNEEEYAELDRLFNREREWKVGVPETGGKPATANNAKEQTSKEQDKQWIDITDP
eukprot:gnl/MRDRNA2_/MRDRNA2_78354_c0_seq2.p2 gnl/MRDRNA2_/MRDRNA2_78354_c0~~gnl/MRDRNA2_/MRDRNA2_78354_c0_seq2.p2  ORF type:complete len:162 (-),score=31.84 gnl/MRDRNA2_/MRDRNA2_78354_c0_seq2:160-645(-)